MPVDSINSNKAGRQICAFCGFKDDRETTISYPSEFNYCYHCLPINTISLSHQKDYCLQANYLKCPIYAKDKFEKMPKEFRGKEIENLWKKTWRILLLASILIIGGFFIANYFGWLPAFFTAKRTEITATAIQTNIIKTLTETSIPPTATLTQTLTPIDTVENSNPTQIVPHTLEYVFGQSPQLLIHKIIEGEGFIMLAEKYETSVEAIKAINYQLPETLLVNKIIVIPVNNINVVGVPSFSVFEILDSGSTLQEIATKFKINLDIFLKFNDLPSDYIPSKGEWLLIPH